MKKNVLKITPKPFKFEKDVAYFVVEFVIGSESFPRTYLCFVDSTGNLVRVDSNKPIRKTIAKLNKRFKDERVMFYLHRAQPTASKLQADLSDLILALAEEKKEGTFVKLNT